jgi:hypothetical protein
MLPGRADLREKGSSMRRILLALRVFFFTLFRRETAEAVEAILTGGKTPEPTGGPPSPQTVGKSTRSDALTLLAALQREARLVDFVKESLDGYTDAQIGAAARDVHRDSGRVLNRLFGIEPVLDEQEGAAVEVAGGFDPGCYQLTGNVTGEPPFRGRLRHHGWRATACRLPAFSGSPAAAEVLAPAEVELA